MGFPTDYTLFPDNSKFLNFSENQDNSPPGIDSTSDHELDFNYPGNIEVIEPIDGQWFDLFTQSFLEISKGSQSPKEKKRSISPHETVDSSESTLPVKTQSQIVEKVHSVSQSLLKKDDHLIMSDTEDSNKQIHSSKRRRTKSHQPDPKQFLQRRHKWKRDELKTLKKLINQRQLKNPSTQDATEICKDLNMALKTDFDTSQIINKIYDLTSRCRKKTSEVTY